MTIRCSSVHKTFVTAQGTVIALDDVSFEVGEREIVSMVGPSGCGKSTLLRIVAGLLEPDAGTVEVPSANGRGRPSSALVFQDHGLFPWKTVLDNVAFGLQMGGRRRPDSRARARDLVERVGLGDFAEHYPHQLSVGMRQRVNLARAFVVDPQLLLMDEPFAALDAQTRIVLQEELLETWRASPKSILYVTHDIEEAVLMGDRVLVMSGRPGRIRDVVAVPLARPRELASRGDPVVADLVSRIWRQIEDEVRGSLSAPARSPAGLGRGGRR
ncbi:MAG TPA: ABC transporter ATP-binding protein [Thermoanaerobaculia bacterium]|nr:ABC transporter ATP-binding protein [Thermoanaerobaculia bacterium]